MYVALCEASRCMVVWCPRNMLRRQQFHITPAMSALLVHHFGGYSKKKKKVSHLCRITCKHSESAQELKIAPNKSEQQQHIYGNALQNKIQL